MYIMKKKNNCVFFLYGFNCYLVLILKYFIIDSCSHSFRDGMLTVFKHTVHVYEFEISIKLSIFDILYLMRHT
jgi:hypothetical protein